MAEAELTKPEEFSEEYYELCLKYLQSRQITVEERDAIERNTVGQSSSPEWMKIRKQILSSTKFHRVITKKKTTSCENIVKDIIYGNTVLNNDSPSAKYINIPKAMKWGRDHEHIARKTYTETYGNEVEDCGIFLDVPYGILGASPDGLVDTDGLLEIKCPYTAAINNAEDVKSAVENKFIQFLKLSENGELHLRRDHQYYFQIIGQLSLSGRKWCDFYVWLSEEIPSANFLERIYANDQLWELLEPELRRFYETCILPELVEPQFTIGKRIKNCPFVIDERVKLFLNKIKDEDEEA